MKKNRLEKKAQFMALYLPIMTLFMVALVVGMYYIQNGVLDNHMVSPVNVLELEDSKEIFEIREGMLARGSAFQVGWRAEDFKTKMEEKFCSHFIEPDYEKLRNFLLRDLVHEGRRDARDLLNSDSSLKSFCKSVYDFEWNKEKNVLIVKRENVGKYRRLEAIKRDKINFVVDFEWDLSETFEIPGSKIFYVYEGGG